MLNQITVAIDNKVLGQIFLYFYLFPLQAKVYRNLSPHFNMIVSNSVKNKTYNNCIMTVNFF